jgi:hypothetical protein
MDIHTGFLFTVGSDSQRGKEHGKHFADDEEVETEVQKWLTQQSMRRLCCQFQHHGKAMGQVYQCWGRIC